MSYNTRRTGAGTGRTSAPTTQVNYHQQPAARTGNANPAQSRGYTTTQQTGYNSAGYSTQSQPAFTTQPPAPAPPKSSQPPSTPAPSLTAQKPETPTPPVKQEPITPAGTPQNTTTTEATENGEGTPKMPFWRKRPFVKISNKVKRARQNAKLRRILNPKNPLTFLNELKPGGVKFVVREETGWGFIASVDIDGKTFSGTGFTVSKAKSVASEHALKYLLLEQMSKAQTVTPATTDKDDSKEESESKEEEEVMETDEKDDDGEPKDKKAKTEAEDELPWGSLAAFALHKLFTEWQKEGIEMPYQDKFDDEGSEDSYFGRRPEPIDDYGYTARRFRPYPPRGRGFGPFPGPRGPPPPNFMMPRHPGPPPAATFLNNPRPSLPTAATAQPTSILPMKKIPDDANKRHPVMLLNQLKPHIVYNETREGDRPTFIFKISVDLDGKEYVGRGKSKKEAKKQVAKTILATMGVQYDDE